MGVMKEKLAEMVNTVICVIDAGDEVTFALAGNPYCSAYNVFRDGDLYYCINYDGGAFVDCADEETVGNKVEHLILCGFEPFKSYPRQTAYNLERMRTMHAKKRVYERNLHEWETATAQDEREMKEMIEKLIISKKQVRVFFEKETCDESINPKVIVSIYEHGRRGVRIQIFEYERVTEETIDEFNCDPVKYPEYFSEILEDLITEMGCIAIYAI